jgi:hypothetical protein
LRSFRAAPPARHPHRPHHPSRSARGQGAPRPRPRGASGRLPVRPRPRSPPRARAPRRAPPGGGGRGGGRGARTSRNPNGKLAMFFNQPGPRTRQRPPTAAPPRPASSTHLHCGVVNLEGLSSLLLGGRQPTLHCSRCRFTTNTLLPRPRLLFPCGSCRCCLHRHPGSRKRPHPVRPAPRPARRLARSPLVGAGENQRKHTFLFFTARFCL